MAERGRHANLMWLVLAASLINHRPRQFGWVEGDSWTCLSSWMGLHIVCALEREWASVDCITALKEWRHWSLGSKSDPLRE
ncbi:MAG: hypothetical protein CBE00_13475 [Planctomycetaceae bacterium TMED240]|nr:hypothetical protein [Rhodopirellula sp.]OUX03900.1 MAG: hypothetical protein CBE00_13475 [Planctomycetaceae bacterium TMED240]